ncbi:MAG: protein-S-isoprenylcysteine O-methyltransferase [Pseudomonadota bacterium]
MKNSQMWIGAVLLCTLVVVVIWRADVNGWGSIAWLAGTIAMFFIRMPFAQQTAKNTVSLSRKDVLEQALLAGMSVSMMLLPVVFLVSGYLSFANYALPGWITAVGGMGLLPALYLVWRSHADLGQNWSVTLELREGHTLTVSGIYRHIRHPMYAGIWLLVLMQPLLLHNWIAGPTAILCFGLLYALRAPKEEAMMLEEFGAEYQEYISRTKRLIPGLL